MPYGRGVAKGGKVSSRKKGTVMSKKAAEPTYPVWLSYEEAADRTGASVRQLKRAVSLGDIGFTKVGLFVRFSQDQLDEWLTANTFVPRRSS